jgi:hypothetical protein
MAEFNDILLDKNVAIQVNDFPRAHAVQDLVGLPGIDQAARNPAPCPGTFPSYNQATDFTRFIVVGFPDAHTSVRKPPYAEE